MAPGCVFRTVKAKFPSSLIEAEALKAGVAVRITNEDPWLKVAIVGKTPRQSSKPKKKDFHLGASQPYPEIESISSPSISSPGIDIFS